MHPNKFFSEVSCKVGMDVFEMFDEDIKNELKNVHPQNFIKSKINVPVYRIVLEYWTSNGNYKKVNKYAILNNNSEEQYIEFWVDMFVRDFNENNKAKITRTSILEIEKICDAVLRIE